MEDSTFEAIYTGVYIFIFIAALTVTLYMFKNVNELAERSYEYGMVSTGDTLVEAPEEVDKVLHKTDVISYYYNYVNLDNYDSENSENKYTPIYKVEIVNGNELGYKELLNNLNHNDYKITVNASDGGEKIFKISNVE